MKGIILAGGSGTRLYPLTMALSKQLLPIYDKPMIYYPLSILMQFGIKDILIISTPRDTPCLEKLFGNGNHLGLNISYKIQNSPDGIAQAFIIGDDFIGSDEVALILGDNIFGIGQQLKEFKRLVQEKSKNNAVLFSYRVSDPERFGVVEFDKNFKVISIEEKPQKPKSNYVSVGLYFYPSDVVNKAKSLTTSKRGELEISDLNNLYLEENRLSVIPMRRGNAWLDAGTPDSLLDASQFVQIIEKRQGQKIGCIEEVAYKNGFINNDGLLKIINNLKSCSYKSYLYSLLIDYKNT
ncbi:MAG: glucose-1-phosphate thymidylyltransferase RfbA [Succinivibrionaceae bacterium]|nr:glucose-1-phosphate thymidylyltransferase RfbA [Succinivibrionaceae bacterium]